MSEAYETLMKLSNEEIAAYSASPSTDDHIVIGRDRFITVPNALKRLAVQYDKDVETVTFDCPRHWDEHDLATMPLYINYVVPGGNPESYMAMNIVAEDSIVHFDWTISSNVTSTAGPIVFSVCAKTTDEDGNEQIHWNSEKNTECYISEGIECGIINTAEAYPDLITQLLERMTSVEAVRSDAEAAAAHAEECALIASDIQTDVTNKQSDVTSKQNKVTMALNQAKTAAAEASTAAASQVSTKTDAIVQSVEGDSIVLTNASDNPLRGLRVMGRTNQVKTTGKNMVDMSGYEFDDSDYTHMLAPSNKSASDFYNFMRAHPGESIVYSMTVTGTASGIDIGSIRFYDSNSELIVALAPNAPHTIKTDLPETFALSYIYGSGTGASVKNIQVEFGTTVTAYEPYTGAKPAPNPDYPQELENVDNSTVTVNGKNLFDMSKINNTDLITKLDDGTISVSHYYAPSNVRLKALAPGMVVGKRYTLDLDTEGNQFIYLNNYGKIWNAGATMELTDTMYNSTVTLYGKTEQVDGSTIIRKIQFRLAGTSSGIEEYKETQLATVPYTLRGVPAEKNSNYTDSNGKQWICDEVDFERRVFIQRVQSVILDGSRYYTRNAYRYNEGLYVFGTSITNALDDSHVLSDKLTSQLWGRLSASDKNKVFNISNAIYVYLEDQSIQTDAAFKEYVTNNPIEVYYPLKTPIELELTAEDIEAYEALHTNPNNTTILNSSNARMAVDYNLDTNWYVDNKINEALDQFKKQLVNDGYMRYVGKTKTGTVQPGTSTTSIITEDNELITAYEGLVVKTATGVLCMFNGTTWETL